MADITISKTAEQYTKKFQGFSSVRWASRQAQIKDASSWTEFPTLQDSISFSAAEPSITASKIYGRQANWTQSATPGEIAFSLTIPALDDSLIELGFAKKTIATGLTESATTSRDGHAGSWAFSGIDMTMKNIEGMIWLISESGHDSLVIKNFSGYARLVMESGNPVGIALSGQFVAPVANDAEGDVLVGTYTDSQL